jgi:hypothetical protein
MTVERCSECGFDGGRWTDTQALTRLAELPALWLQAIEGISPTDLLRRPIPDMWSIAEYTDHVRETTFGMRFVLEMALTQPGIDLGAALEPRFDPQPRPIDILQSLATFEQEVMQLVEKLAATESDRWSSHATVGNEDVDVHWIVRHAVHDVTHHLGDVETLRASVG